MRKLARDGVPVVGGLQFQNAEQIDDWIRERFSYRPEHEEVLRTIPHMMGQLRDEGIIEGDCDDVSILFASLAHANKIPVRFAAIRTQRQNPAFLHVFVETLDSQSWRRYDPTLQKNFVHQEFDRIIVFV